MKTSRNGRKQFIFNKGMVLIVLITLIFPLNAGIALAASGDEGEAKGWGATDTYRVMNFAVLAIGLFLLLRKPASQALNARIKGIKEQLSDLETRKKEAEKALTEYSERLSLLEKESEDIIAEYIRQGNEAKVRILEEAKQAAEKLEEQARRNIAQEFEQAKFKLQKEILDKAIINAEALITKKITAEDQNTLVDDYLKKVVA
jgi:F-type H+-transporting ATPase subunit b